MTFGNIIALILFSCECTYKTFSPRILSYTRWLYTIWQSCTLDQTCLSDLVKSLYSWELSYQHIWLKSSRIVQYCHSSFTTVYTNSEPSYLVQYVLFFSKTYSWFLVVLTFHERFSLPHLYRLTGKGPVP